MVTARFAPILLSSIRTQSGFFFFKEKAAYEVRLSLGGSEMCIRDRACTLPLYTARLPARLTDPVSVPFPLPLTPSVQHTAPIFQAFLGGGRYTPTTMA